MRYELIPRSPMELIEAGFQLYRNHFATFVGIAAITQGLSFLLQVCQMRAMLGAWTSSPEMLVQTMQTVGPKSVGLSSILSVLQAPVTVVTYIAMETSLNYATGEAYHGRPVGAISALRGAAPRMVTMGICSIVRFLGIGLAFLMLIIPGAMLTLRWAFVAQACTLESLGTGASLARSNTLTDEHRGSVGWLLLFAWLLLGCVGIAFGAVFAPVIFKMPLLGMFLTNVPMIALMPLHTIIMTLGYYDLRIRKEAYDLESASHDLPQDAASLSPPVA